MFTHPIGNITEALIMSSLGKRSGERAAPSHTTGGSGNGNNVIRSSSLRAGSTGRWGHHLEFFKMQIPGHRPDLLNWKLGVGPSSLCLKSYR